MNNKNLIVIAGPTAVGKTSISIKLANHFNAEIISADSRQFFKEMSIGTAKPTPTELQQAKHHFINSHSIHDNYNVGRYESEAMELINTLFKKLDNLILTGGSGLYINAICNGLDEMPPANETLRAELNEILKTKGLNELQELLKIHDPEFFKTAEITNPQRMVRALEVCMGTGKSNLAFRKGTKKNRNFKTIKIGLNIEREKLYEQINSRVDEMMQKGLLDEVRSLLHHRDLNSVNTVGYSELFEYLEGKTDLDKAVSKIKQNTRNYAKRQLTWFKKDPEIKWFTPTEYSEIVRVIEKNIQSNV